MAGRKNYLQQLGMPHKNLNEISDPLERDFAFRSMQATPYCKHCGSIVLGAEQDADGRKVDAKWEMENQAHYSCYLDWKQKEEERLAIEARKRKQAEQIDWDDYIKRTMKQREGE